MNTEDLITMLARQAGPAPRAAAARRLAPALAAGTALGLAGALVFMGPVPAALFAEPGLWLKLVYSAALAAAAVWWAARLARPAAATAVPGRAALAVVAAVLALGGLTLVITPAGSRLAALLGSSWAACPGNVLSLSLPTLAGALWALRGLAPTRPRLAGWAAGVLAGAVGAFSYAFACPEISPAFVAVWYTLGIGLSGALGALIGPRVLRW